MRVSASGCTWTSRIMCAPVAAHASVAASARQRLRMHQSQHVPAAAHASVAEKVRASGCACVSRSLRQQLLPRLAARNAGASGSVDDLAAHLFHDARVEHAWDDVHAAELVISNDGGDGLCCC
jgi:hypothetical protein